MNKDKKRGFGDFMFLIGVVVVFLYFYQRAGK
jgi:hypothetical protein